MDYKNNFREKYVMRRDSDYLGANPPSTWDWASSKADGRDKGHPSVSSSIYLYTVNSNFHINLQYLILISHHFIGWELSENLNLI